MAKGNIGTSLRKAPRSPRTGKYLTKRQSRVGNTLKARDQVIHRFTGQTGTVVEVFRMTAAIRADGTNRLISGRLDEFVVKGHRFADH